MKIDGFNVQGAIDKETRCEHYHTKNDIIALRFYCCNTYFSCFHCHEKYGCGNASVWPRSYFNRKAILCGECKVELTINAYLNSENLCPSCNAPFNSGCLLHHHLYFDENA